MVASMQQQQQYAGMAPSGSSGGGGGGGGGGSQGQQHMYLPPSQMSKYMNVSTIQQHRAAMFAVREPILSQIIAHPNRQPLKCTLDK